MSKSALGCRPKTPTKNELEQFIQQLNTETKTVIFQALPELYQVSQYNKMEQLFNCAHKYNTLFPMPIWEVLDGVEKSEVRNTLNRLINNENEKYNDERVRTGKPRIVRINSTEEFLDIILTSFEMSEYKTLLDYFVAEEYRWLQDYQLQADYDHMGEDLNLRKLGDFVKSPRVMNEHTFGYVKEEEIVLDDDNAGGLGNTKTIVNFPHQTQFLWHRIVAAAAPRVAT